MMISFEKPGVPAALNIGRVRLLAPFVLAAMPVGWALIVLNEGTSRPLSMAGFFIMVAGLVATLGVIPTGVQRIAGGLEEGLDEFQLVARLRAQSAAYRWFSLWVLVMALAASLAPAFGADLALDSMAVNSLFLWVIGWSVALPAWFLAHALPQPVDDEG